MKRRIIGVDPGLASAGWGIIDAEGNRVLYVAHGCVETTKEKPRAERLFSICTEFKKILKKYGPAEAAIETLYFGKNISSAIPVAEARGAISALLAERGLPVRELTPNAIKQGVTGIAVADKRQVQEMVRIILGITEVPRPDHAADALAAAICCAQAPAGDL